MGAKISITKYLNAHIKAIRDQIKSLKEFHTEREKRFREQFDNQETALRKFNDNLVEYKAQTNEWRGQIRDQESTFLKSQTFEEFAKAQDDKFAAYKKTQDEKVYSLERAINTLNLTDSKSEGKSDWIKNMWMVVAGLVGLAGIAIALISLLMHK